MLGELNKEESELLLKTEILGRIGCCAEDEIYVVPVTYVYDGTYVYAHSKEGKKIRLMRNNPRVCFEIDHMDDLSNWKSVIAAGSFEELKDERSRQQAMNLLMEKIRPKITSGSTVHPHANQDQDGPAIQAVIFRIRLHGVTGRFERSGKNHQTALASKSDQ